MTSRLRGSILLFLVAGFAPSLGAAGDDGFVSLFNGKDLTGWEGDARLWSVRDGAITGQTTKQNPDRGNTFLIYKGGDVSDFELRVTCRIVGGNSGIQYRSKITDPKQWVLHGYQADFGPGDSHNGKLYDEGGKRGAIASPGQKVVVRPDGRKDVASASGDPQAIRKGIADNEWYEYVVVARGNHLVHTINGQVMTDTVDGDKNAFTSGVLGLQIHAGEPMTVQFKDVRLKKL